MKGIVKKYQGNRSCFWIAGENGEDFFAHESDVVNCRKIQKTNIVEFTPVDDPGKPCMRAINIRKIGLGESHPFVNDLEKAISFVQKSSDDPECKYVLKNLEMIKNYFIHAEDFEWCKDPEKTFNVKGNDSAE